jgi:hypothetical protein
MINAVEAKKIALKASGRQAEAQRIAERQRREETAKKVAARVDDLMPLIEADVAAVSKRGLTGLHLRADSVKYRHINLDHTNEIRRRMKPLGYRVWHDTGGGVIDITVIDWKEADCDCPGREEANNVE